MDCSESLCAAALQAEGIITEEELRKAHRQIQSEESIINEQLGRMERFRKEPAPPDMATFKRLAEYWTGEIASDLYHASDDARDRFAELFDMHATIRPDSSLDGYHFDLSANIPLEMEGDKPSAYDIVFSPSRGGGSWEEGLTPFRANLQAEPLLDAPLSGVLGVFSKVVDT